MLIRTWNVIIMFRTYHQNIFCDCDICDIWIYIQDISIMYSATWRSTRYPIDFHKSSLGYMIFQLTGDSWAVLFVHTSYFGTDSHSRNIIRRKRFLGRYTANSFRVGVSCDRNNVFQKCTQPLTNIFNENGLDRFRGVFSHLRLSVLWQFVKKKFVDKFEHLSKRFNQHFNFVLKST